MKKLIKHSIPFLIVVVNNGKEIPIKKRVFLPRRAILQKNPPLGGFFFLVEVVGIEPTSYSAAKKLSTYLVRLLFLFLQRGRTRFTVRR